MPLVPQIFAGKAGTEATGRPAGASRRTAIGRKLMPAFSRPAAATAPPRDLHVHRHILLMTDDPIVLAKAALRLEAAVRRDAAHAAGGETAAGAVARHGIGVLGERSFRTISGYWPMRSEMDLRPLLGALANAGRDVALPAVLGLGQPLQFRRWRPGEALGDRPLRHGPSAARGEAIIEPDVLLVPLLAYDDRHHRLGYGAGFYDRTLAGLRARKRILVIGVAYSAQRVVADVPGTRRSTWC